MYGWHGWLLDWILYIDDKLTDGRTLLVVKSLSRLKITDIILGVIDNNILQVRGLIKVVERGGQPESPQHQQQK